MKKVVLLVFTFLCILSASAQTVPSDIAKKAAASFWSKSFEGTNASAQLSYFLLESSDTLLFIYNVDNSGFVIVAGDYSSNPILGYSTEGTFNIDQAPAFKNWIENYSGRIAAQRHATHLVANPQWNELLANNSLPLTKQSTKAVAALCTTRWDQGKYYNHSCPAYATGPDGHCVTGCVSTAMAQVMKYYNYPATGFGFHSYPHPYFGLIAADFSATTYDWAAMGNSGNATNQDAISTLIFNCGVSVDMDYNPLESGAQSANAVTALKDYFHYRNTIEILDRNDYPYLEWITILKDNLDEQHPIFYSGTGSGGGHAWVCDGYDNSNKFHMNWGWSGSNNGFFQVDTLNAGGYSFSSGEQAIVNIMPYFAPYCMASRTFTDSTRVFGDGSGYSYYWNNTACDWLIQPTGAEKVVLQFTSDFNTELNKDVVSIYDGSTTSDPLLGSFSGTDMPPTLTANSGKMLIVFTTDSITQGLGWTAKYWALKHGAGITENELGKVNVYPNPATNDLFIQNQLDINENVAINIYDFSGKEVYAGTQNMSNYQTSKIDVSALNAGFYIISFQSEHCNYRTKFIKE